MWTILMFYLLCAKYCMLLIPDVIVVCPLFIFNIKTNVNYYDKKSLSLP